MTCRYKFLLSNLIALKNLHQDTQDIPDYPDDDVFSILTSKAGKPQKPAWSESANLRENNFILGIQKEETENLRKQIRQDTKEAMEYFEAENRKRLPAQKEVERDLKMMKYNKEMKSLRSKRDRIKQAIQMHKASRVYNQRLLCKVLDCWKYYISKHNESIARAKEQRSRLLRVSFESLRLQSTVASPVLPKFQNQFRVLTDAMYSWRRFCSIQKGKRELKLKHDTAAFIYNTKVKYRVFQAMCSIRYNAQLMRCRLHFSAWKDRCQNSNASTRHLSLIVLRAWRDVADNQNFNAVVLHRVFCEWKNSAYSQRRLKQALSFIFRQRLIRKSFWRFYDRAIVVPEERVRFHLQKKFLTDGIFSRLRKKLNANIPSYRLSKTGPCHP